MKRSILIVVAVAAVLAVVAYAALSGGAAAPGLVDNAQFKRIAANGARIVDVRTEAEYAGAHIAGAETVPLSMLAQVASGWDTARPIAVYCATGSRSAEAAAILTDMGFTTVYDLRGGIVQWDGELAAGAQASVAGAQPSTSGLPVMYEFYTDW